MNIPTILNSANNSELNPVYADLKDKYLNLPTTIQNDWSRFYVVKKVVKGITDHIKQTLLTQSKTVKDMPQKELNRELLKLLNQDSYLSYFSKYKQSVKIQNKIKPSEYLSKKELNELITIHTLLKDKTDEKRRGIILFLQNTTLDMFQFSKYKPQDPVAKVEHFARYVDWGNVSMNAYLETVNECNFNFGGDVSFEDFKEILDSKQAISKVCLKILESLQVFYLD